MAKRKMTVRGSFSGPDPRAIVGALVKAGLIPAEAPEELEVDTKTVPSDVRWLDHLASSKRSVNPSWGDRRFAVVKSDRVQISVPDYEMDVVAFAEALSGVPFEVAAFDTIYVGWPKDPGYEAPGFPGAPWDLGWGLALRGAGHDRVVSRRWIDYSPVRVVRPGNDTTLVQFHDLDADARTSAAQAEPGHKRLTSGAAGGALQARGVYKFTHGLKGTYVPGERTVHVIVNRREITDIEMRDAAAARIYQPLGKDEPVDNVVFVFADEDNLKRYLPLLWQYGLRVNRLDESGEKPADEGYQPPAPEKPAWVKALGRDDRASDGPGK